MGACISINGGQIKQIMFSYNESGNEWMNKTKEWERE